MSKRQDNDRELMVSYINQIKKLDLLSAEEEIALANAVKSGNRSARDKLVRCNLRLVVKIASSYKVTDVALTDLIQEGNLGLIRAAEKFEAEKGVRFATYAVWWIKQSINRYLMTKRRSIRLPARKEELVRKLQFVYSALQQKLGRMPNEDEVAAEAGIDVQEMRAVLDLSLDGMVSLDSAPESDAVLSAASRSNYAYSPEETYMREDAKKAALDFIASHLLDKEKNVLMYRYQFNGSCEPRSFKNIGEKFGLSTETVRQIEMRALSKLRGEADSYAECLYA